MKMRPAQGDAVKFTDRFLNNSPLNWTSALKDTELLVARIKISTMAPFKVFTVFLMVNNMMYKVDVNETGHFVDANKNIGNDIVFEPFHNPANASVTVGTPLNPQPVSVPSPAWAPNAPAQPSKPVTEDEANATCPKCGAPAVDLIFSVKCTNPGCSNYR
jgi:hypothetical protein